MDKDSLYQQAQIENNQIADEGVVEERSPLTLELDDKEVAETTKKWISDSKQFFTEKYNLYDRRKKNEEYLWGRQIEQKEKNRLLKAYEARYLDNVIYEIEASLKPLAMSRLPDMIVTPGNDSTESEKVAKDISKCIDTDIKKRQNRQVLGIAFKHHPVYFTGIIKVRWNPEINDFIFENVHPDYVDIDNTCNTKNADDMKWIAQTLPISVQECIMRFPDKKEELFEELRKDGIDIGESATPKTKGLLSEIKIREIWFDWYKQEGDKWNKISAVMWKYKEVVLKKLKNPNFDYEGEQKLFTYDLVKKDSKRVLTGDELLSVMTNGGIEGQLPPGVQSEQIFRNYFEFPRKPFFFIGYDQWRKIAYDETSRIEQNIRNQENLDRTGKSIIEKLKARIKHVFSKDGGLKKSDIEQMDMDDDRQDLLVEGKVGDVHATITPPQPTPQEFKSQDDSRSRMYSLAGATAIRGQLQSDVATSNQIAREADFTRADDLVEDTINDAAEWMAQWALHMIKLRYTEDHFRKLSGASGKITFMKLNRDLIEDGMEVKIKSSGTDRLKAEKRANDMAAMKMIDPLNYFKDIGLENPEGRTEDLLMFTADPASYMAKVKGLGSTVPQLVNSLQGNGQPNQTTQSPTVPQAEVQQTPTTLQPTPTDTASVPPTPVGPPQGSPRVL